MCCFCWDFDLPLDIDFDRPFSLDFDLCFVNANSSIFFFSYWIFPMCLSLVLFSTLAAFVLDLFLLCFFSM